MDLKSIRGQFFTKNEKIQEILVSLLTPRHDWRVLEPSAGAGDIVRAVKKSYPEASITGWEIDENVAPRGLNVEIRDFFTPTDEKFHSIIGNPPYVGWKNVEDGTKKSAAEVKQGYSDKANLYYLFMDRCIDLLEDGGELIFIQPKEWLYSTSALPIREKMLREGMLTHVIDGGEEKVFSDADVPAIMIFRFEKGKKSHSFLHKHGFFSQDLWSSHTLSRTEDGFWIFLTEEMAEELEGMKKLGDFFSVRVGIVSGADKIFNVSNNPQLSVFQEEGTVKRYRTTKTVEQYIDVHDYTAFEQIPEHTRKYLLSHKEALIKRKIASFHEGNWWRYGAIRNKKLMESSSQRIYAFAKTRSETPFFVDDSAVYYGGGLLGLFPKKDIDIKEALETLNSRDFRKICEAFGLTTANKVSFQPKTLESVPFPFEG